MHTTVKPKISVLINTFNEEKNIKNCLETVKWADEIIIVDMHSEDATIEIARQYTDKIFFFERMGYADPARQFALEKASNEWILVVDADELVPKKLTYRLFELADSDIADIIWIPRNNYFFGHLMQGSGCGPLQDAQARFFKRGFMNFSPVVHSIYKISKNARQYKIGRADEGFVHLNYIDVEHYLEKINKYTTIEAENMYEQIKPEPSHIKFIYNLFFKEFRNSFKDGFQGFTFISLRIAYHMTSMLKYKIMQKYKTKEPKNKIMEEYNKIAADVIKDYEIRLPDL